MKKNKKTILLAVGGGGLLVVTSVAIAIPAVLASSNSDEQAIKAAQTVLEKLTLAQKTVNLTKVINQKLPSRFKISSMETLNDLLKKAIVILDDITYTPRVIKTNNTKGEIGVEIEIKKGAVSATVNFTIAGFITIAQVQANLETALAKIGNNTISGDATKLPSSMDSTSIVDLRGFPPTTTNGVHFSVVAKGDDDTKGELVITLRATKEESSKTKEIVISGFKTQAQANQIVINMALATIDENTIKGDSTKLPSQMTMSLIKALPSFPPSSNGVDFDVKEKILVDSKGIHYDMSGKLIIILKASKNGINDTKELTISGFKTQAQANQIVINMTLAAIDENTIKGDSTKLPSAMDVNSIKTLVGFPPTTNGAHFSVVAKDDDDTKGELVITLRATKEESSKTKEIVISGFKTQAQANQIVINMTLAAIDENTIKGDSTKLPSAMDVNSIKTLVGFPPTTNGAHFSVVAKDDDDTKGELVITLRATKEESSKTKEIVISGFKTQAQANQIVINMTLAAIDENTIKGDSTKLPSAMDVESIKTLVGFPPTTNEVHFSAILAGALDIEGLLDITLIATKGDASENKNIRISGFRRSTQVQAEIDAAKAILDNLDATTTTKNISQTTDNIRYTSFAEFISKIDLSISDNTDQVTLSKVTIQPYIIEYSNTSIKVQLYIYKIGASSTKSKHHIIVNGFKSKEQIINDDIKAKLAKINNSTIFGDETKLASEMLLESITNLEGFPPTTESGVSFRTTVLNGDDDTKGQLEITLTATKGDISVNKKITISGFDTIAVQFDRAIVISELTKIFDASISGDNTKLASEITIESFKTLAGFPPTINEVHFSVTLTSANDVTGTLLVILKATKNKASKSKEMTLNGFKKLSKEEAETQIDTAKSILVNFNTRILDNTQTAAEVTYIDFADFITKTNIPTLTGATKVALEQVTIAITADPQGDTSQRVTLTISKAGITKAIRVPIVVSKFKSANQADVDVAKVILDSCIYNSWTFDNTQTAAEVTYIDFADFITKTNIPTLTGATKVALEQVTIAITADPQGDTSQRVTLTISKASAMTTTSTIVVKGFKSANQADVDVYKKLFVAKTTTTEIEELSSAVEYGDLTELNTKTSVALPLPVGDIKVGIEVVSRDGYQFVNLSFTKVDKIARHTIEVTGFKSAQVDRDVLNNYKKKLPIKIWTNTWKKSSEVEYVDLIDFRKKTIGYYNIPGPGIKTRLEIINRDGYQFVGLYLSKGVATTTHVIRVLGFEKS